MCAIRREPGSYRDSRGFVFYDGDRVCRSVHRIAAADYEAIRDSGVIAESVRQRFLIPTAESSGYSELRQQVDGAYVLEHERIPFISYPYEWCFRQLKLAALHHLEYQMFLLSRDVMLRDANAFNIQFIGSAPIFIDLLSLAPYREGEYWLGHMQFCRQFLNPLLLWSVVGVPPNPWLRGALEGISSTATAKMLPYSSMLSWTILTHVFVQASLERRRAAKPEATLSSISSRRPLPKAAYKGLLEQLHRKISKLSRKNSKDSIWEKYSQKNSYSETEESTKKSLVLNLVQNCRPSKVIDLGCNDGVYSNVALGGGAGYAVGFDFDIEATDRAFQLSEQKQTNFLPLYVDLANPSPAQGWMEGERQGLRDRCRADLVIAFAVVHHLVIGRNIRIAEVVDWITSIAPVGLIEFVPKTDPVIPIMLALRDEEPVEYTEELLITELNRRVEITEKTRLDPSGRTIFSFRRLGL